MNNKEVFDGENSLMNQLLQKYETEDKSALKEELNKISFEGTLTIKVFLEETLKKIES